MFFYRIDLTIWIKECQGFYESVQFDVSSCNHSNSPLIRVCPLETSKRMETEGLFECDGLRFGYYSAKPKYICNQKWRNEIQAAWDNLVQEV